MSDHAVDSIEPPTDQSFLPSVQCRGGGHPDFTGTPAGASSHNTANITAEGGRRRFASENSLDVLQVFFEALPIVELKQVLGAIHAHAGHLHQEKQVRRGT